MLDDLQMKEDMKNAITAGTGKGGKCSRTYMVVTYTADKYGWIFR